MKKFSLLVAGLTILLAAPASAETVVIKKRHGGHDDSRAEMTTRGHHSMDRGSYSEGHTAWVEERITVEPL